MDRVTTKHNRTLQLLVMITIIVMVGTFYTLTIREGHDWGDDFGMYIRHAMNIVEGRDYVDTGYIPNPFAIPTYSSQAYPPVFPLLLSPVYYWFGLNLQAMKVEIILLFSVFCSFAFYREVGVDYLVLRPDESNLAGQYAKARKADLKLTLVYTNPDFRVYKICYGECIQGE